jgi:hypothetical protein
MSLIDFIATLAVDPALFARYLAAPTQVADELNAAEAQEILSSGDRRRIAEQLGMTDQGAYYFPAVFTNWGGPLSP